MIRTLINPNKLPKQAASILEAIAGEGYIAGGYARDVLLGTHTSSDIDIFCYKQLAIYLDPEGGLGWRDAATTTWLPRGRIVTALEQLGYEYTRQLPNALEFTILRKDSKPDHNYRKVQLIVPFKNQWMFTFGRPEDVIGQFDFTVVMAALETVTTPPLHNSLGLTHGTERVCAIYHEDFHKHSKAKRLYIQHINCPIAVTMRVNKYVAKGFFAGPKELIKLFQEWDKRDKRYKDRLVDFANRNDALSPTEWWEIEKLLRID